MTENPRPSAENPWRGAGPELLIAAIAAIATALAGYAVAGWPGLAVTAAGAAALSVVVVRALAPRSADDTVRRPRTRPSAKSISGYGQRRFMVSMAVDSLPFYESDLRPALEHLLAARLAERHSVNLYTEPEAARRTFCRSRADEALWRWIAPARPSEAAAAPATKPGIPRRTLARLVDRLEHL
jgi:hypothetical protein